MEAGESGKLEVVDVEDHPDVKKLLDFIREMGYIITDVKIEERGVSWDGHHKDDETNKTRGFVEFIKN